MIWKYLLFGFREYLCYYEFNELQSIIKNHGTFEASETADVWPIRNDVRI